MFDKEKFALIIKSINEVYENQTSFANASGVNRTYLSQYMNLKLDSPPTPKILRGIAEKSRGVTSYEELMNVCGYSEETLESKVQSIYDSLKEFVKAIDDDKDNSLICYTIVSSIESFGEYIDLFEKNFSYSQRIFLTDIFNKDVLIEDYKYVSGFLLLYDSFLKCLCDQNYISIISYDFHNWSNIDNIYANLSNFNNWELLSLSCEQIKFTSAYYKEDIRKYAKKFFTCLNLSHLSEYDNSSLTKLFKSKTQNKLQSLASNEEIYTIENRSNIDNNFQPVPILGKIAAGQPILAEEYIEGYLPVDPNIYGVSTAEDLFFLRIAGNSMNLKVKNGDYALIKKQDYAEDGDIIAVIVNSDDEATLKRYKKLNDQFILLEPMSTDSTIESITVDLKTTKFQIVGKAIGQFGKF